jgi:hypothetical protein
LRAAFKTNRFLEQGRLIKGINTAGQALHPPVARAGGNKNPPAQPAFCGCLDGESACLSDLFNNQPAPPDKFLQNDGRLSLFQNTVGFDRLLRF